jgi:superfamily II DNA or RNA helicase
MLWPHQRAGIDDFFACVEAGYQAIALTSPTGMGKTRIVAQILREYFAGRGLFGGEGLRRALLYTGRRMLLDQLKGDMGAEGIRFSVRAAGDTVERLGAGLTIASIHTDKARTKKWPDFLDGPEVGLVIVDEAHLHCKGREDLRVLKSWLGRGAVLLGPTASPLDMGGLYQRLVVAGKVSDGFACGALVRARHYGPDEPALAGLPAKLDAAVSEEKWKGTMMRKGVFGRVLESFNKLNRWRKPTVLFAPGVKEARHFAKEFYEAGITAASVDAQEVWINGEEVADQAAGREEVARGSEDGSITVVCNRFVLREGINWPWLAHCIFACVFDSTAAYLQAGGRVLRAHPSLKTVSIQDHGGNWRRHGSLNHDREWSLAFSAKALMQQREADYRDPDAPPLLQEPQVCERCKAVVVRPPCLACGHDWPPAARTRDVVQVDGTLVRVTGKMFRPFTTQFKADTVAKWRSVYFRCKNTKKVMTFHSAYGLFFHLHGYYPPKNLPWMPTDRWDWGREVRKVEPSALIPDPVYSGDRPVTRKKRAKKTKSLFEEP